MKFLKKYASSLLPIIGSVVLYIVFAYFLERTSFIKAFSLYLGLFYCAWRIIKLAHYNFWVVAGIGVVMRGLFLFAVPNLSQDFYRFLWDGRLLLQGVTPYLFTPDHFMNNLPPNVVTQNWSPRAWSSITMPNGDELYAGMGSLNASHYSNYPPINQLCFAIAALFAKNTILGSIIVLRIVIILADVGILYLGKKLLEKLELPIHHIFWYFLNPFILIELTGNLHFEGVMMFFFIFSIYQLHKGNWKWAAILLGISISVKLLPLLFLPLYLGLNGNTPIKKVFWKLKNSVQIILFYTLVVATVLLTFAPFISSTFISNFAATIGLWFQKFEFNASIYYIIRWIGYKVIGWNIIETVGKILPLIVVLIILSISIFRSTSTVNKIANTKHLITAMLFSVICYLMLSTTVHPWYLTTPLLLSIFTRYKFPIVWSVVVFFSYAAYSLEGFNEILPLVALEYSVVLSIAVWEIFYSEHFYRTFKIRSTR